jgi:hypothetical protein
VFQVNISDCFASHEVRARRENRNVKNKGLFVLIAAGALATVGCSGASAHRPEVAATSACHLLGDPSPALTTVYQPNQVYAAKPIERTEFRARAIQPRRTVGAELHTRATAGVTPEYLQRTLSCHAAYGTPAHPNDPLHPAQGTVAEVRVLSTGDGFAVQVIGDSPAAGRDIWQRAEAFTTPSGGVTVQQVGSAELGSTSM